jgi:hypothetical protein
VEVRSCERKGERREKEREREIKKERVISIYPLRALKATDLIEWLREEGLGKVSKKNKGSIFTSQKARRDMDGEGEIKSMKC